MKSHTEGIDMLRKVLTRDAMQAQRNERELALWGSKRFPGKTVYEVG